MRLHVVAMPHTQTTHEYLHCAYTQKVVKFTKMMVAEGHEVVLYSGEENEAVCTEHVQVVSEAERLEQYGRWDPNGLFGNLDWNPETQLWPLMNARVIVEMKERARPHDFLCLVAGWSQHPIAAAFPNVLPVEWAVGYEGIYFPHRIFESYAWMHHVYGLRGIKDGAAFDAVIPNFFDPDDFPAGQGGDYLLYVGRIVARKGPHVAAEIAARVGRKLVIAGPGILRTRKRKRGREQELVASEITIRGNHVEYVGSVGREERARLMGGAAAVIVPTQYVEPFGGVAVEAMMCGTPVVTTDWGAFTETVLPRLNGYRFHTLLEAAVAVESAAVLDRERVRDSALRRFSLDAVGPSFTDHFRRLDTLWREGWYE